jgi:hypothetical protein
MLGPQRIHRSELDHLCPRGECTKKPLWRTDPDQRVCGLTLSSAGCPVLGNHLASTAAAVIGVAVVVVVVVGIVSRSLALSSLATPPGSRSGGSGALRGRPPTAAPSQSTTVRDDHGDIGAHVAAVISSPDLDVFAVTAAGPGLRRGHGIYSGVFAVVAVRAAVVSWCFPSLRLARPFGLRGPRAR